MYCGDLQGDLSAYALADDGRDWRGRKMRNEMLAMAYDYVNPSKAARLRDCSSVLMYRRYNDGKMVLDGLRSCRVRLCPICSWRRSLKAYAQTREIINYLSSVGKYRYIMLTLTLRNCYGDNLSSTLDVMTKGWDRFAKLRPFRASICGWYRSLEITHDVNPIITYDMYHGNASRHIYARGKYYRAHGLHIGDVNPNYDMYHPHFHVLLAVSPSYFTGRKYVRQSLYSDWWRNSIRVDYQPTCDVRTVRGYTAADIDSAVGEIAGYAAKDSDYIVPDDWDLTVDTVRTLDAALAHRRLIAYGGCMVQAKRDLKQDDVETGDLVHISDEVVSDEKYEIISYFWYSGYRQYYSF